MFKVIGHAFQVLRIGQQLTEPGAWKQAQLIASLLTALLGLAWAFGLPIALLPDEVAMIAGAIVALLNAYVTVASTRKIGLPDRRVAEGSPADRAEPPGVDAPVRVRGDSEPVVPAPSGPEDRGDRWRDSGFNG